MPVKGKEEPQEAYELIRPGEVETRMEAAVAKGLTSSWAGKRRWRPFRRRSRRPDLGTVRSLGSWARPAWGNPGSCWS